MRDEYDSRAWVDHHDGFADAIDALFAGVKTSFCRFARIRFAAPWRPRGKAC